MNALRESAAALHETDTLLLWDNSPEPQDAEALRRLQEALPAKLIYRHHPENTPLSRVYNEAVALDVPYDLLVFLDQDSSFDARYLEALQEAAAAHPEIALFAPLIRVDEKVVSPGHFRYFKGKYWSAPQWGKVPAENTVAVMSGLAVRRSFFRKFGCFDERFRLYGIDTNLMLRHAKLHSHFFVLDAPFGHDLSDFAEESAATRRFRFEEFYHSSLLNAEWLPLPARLLTRLFLWYRRLRFRA